MKKKISLLLCVIVLALSFTGCSGKADTLSTEQKETMKTHSELLFQLCIDPEALIGIPQDEFLEDIRSYSEFEMNSFILSLNSYISQYKIESIKIDGEEFKKIFDAWDAAIDECGEFKDAGQFVLDEKEHTASVKAQFKDRTATVTFAFDEDGSVKSMDVAAKYSTKEILTKAGLNTVLGMGVVFSVLIFLAFLISLMKYIPLLLERKTDNNQVVQEMDVEEEQQEEVEDDLELIAVITAAIAAQEGTGTDGFVVRSIKRRPSNHWS